MTMTRNQIILHIALYALTLVSTLIVGGVFYAAAIVAILTAHEMGHYVQCRRYHVPATLPFFIPMPFSPFGTMGAVIRMKGPLYERRALFDIAVSGPIAGLVLAVPTAMLGIHLSQVVNLSTMQQPTLPLGDSILFRALVRWIAGPIPEGHDLLLHPLAFAGWAGLFVTALNLLPVGRLDGGHILYALLGSRRALPLSLMVMGGFAALGMFFYRGWVVMILLILLFGLRHPPFWEQGSALGLRRKILGAIVLLFFLISFTPTPIPLESGRDSKPVEESGADQAQWDVRGPETTSGGAASAAPAAGEALIGFVSG